MRNRYAFNRRLPYLLLAPSVIVLLALILYPLAFALRNSFWFWNLQTSPMPLYHSGWDNYHMVFQVTPFGVALKNTLLLGFFDTFAQFWFGLGIALLLHTHLRGMGVMRALLIMPTTLAPVVAGFLFRHQLEPKGGVLPWLLGGIGFPVPPQGFLGNANAALFSIGVVDTWQWTPFFAIVLYAGLLSMSEEIKEAAQVGGAAPWRMFWSITLPLLCPIAAFLVMIRFMQLFNSFHLVYVLTNGGPGSASRTLSINLFREGLVNYNIGLTAAMTWLVAIIVSSGATLLSLPFALSVAYALSRFSMRGKECIMNWYISLLIAPPIVFVIPYFILMSRIGWAGAYQAMIVTLQTLAIPFSVWLLKSFMDEVPLDLEEAAWVDGANRFAAFFRIIIPLALPGIIVTSIFTFVFSWNNVIFPLALSKQSRTTLPVGAISFFASPGVYWGHIAATAVVAMLPPR